VAALAPGGPFHSLVELVTVPEHGKALDLQFRSDPRRPSNGRATLYIGLTKGVDLEVRGQAFRVVPQMQFGLATTWVRRPPWTEWQVASQLKSLWPDALTYIRSTIDAAPERYVRSEGAMQALLANLVSDRFAVVDRESVVGFDPGVKTQFLAPLSSLLSAVVRDLRSQGYSWATADKRFGDEIDALAVDADGRLLVIEVKPGLNTAGVGWTPAQVARYLWLFTAWAQQDPAHAHAVLTGMLAQRVRLGLARHGRVPPKAPPKLIPVIAVCGSVQNPSVANQRMLAVHDALRGADIDLDELEVWQVTDDGMITTRRLGQLA
jgi:hypothetical protein